MLSFYRTLFLAILILPGFGSHAQKIIKGKVVDATTKEPIGGATIHCIKEGCNCGCTTNFSGEFEMKYTDCQALSVSSVGYTAQQFLVSDKDYVISLNSVASQLQEVVLTANRGEGQKRSEAPVAITTISSKTIQDAKPTMVDQVLNKVSGVNMVSLGNEQHQMSIRQPMTTKSLFLYLEDGIPIRTSGLYNHNALLEMNMAATKSIEVIKGPSSSLYGSEAIGGVVNFISAAPSAVPVLKLSAQGNNVGYKRADLISSFSKGKWGVVVSGYYADKRNGFLEYSDFHKGTFTTRVDYRFSDKTTLSSSLTYLNYYSDMSGGIDSAMFASRTFKNLQTFTYRKVDALRYHSTLTHIWNDKSKTTITALYRDNIIGQNPAYRVRDDYRKVNGSFAGRRDLAHGEINENGFNSYSFIAQHRQHLNWKRAVVIGGLNVDLSPSTYTANYIRIKKDTVSKKYVSYQSMDSTLTDYATKLNNYAAFTSFEFNPLAKLRVVASLRYDYFHYGFRNHLKPSAFSGSPDTINNFSRISPKLGFTYNFSNRTGIYANYSEGFVPPQVTELYTGVKVPNLRPSIFYNYEVGGWVEIIKSHLSADISAYRLRGTNEVISVKLDDGTFSNQNAGRTLHRGIEFGLNASPIKDISLRVSGAYSKHEFVSYVEKGAKYDGNDMSNAPNWIYNAEIWYRPSFIKGLRINAELQHVGSYYVDPQNSSKYDGYNTLNVRIGYQFKAFEVWLNVLNATDNYYSYITSKSSSGYSYQLAEPRNFNIGLSYDFGNSFKKKQ
ncbi:MAG TPA: TonB-dependent receptor [Chitinophagaceae bacterium]|nr:TonB-dependent receptor [Chitinophagaceae bacterium]